jgi:hypothetical protein
VTANLKSETVLDELIAALRQAAAEFNSSDETAPAVVLWPDPGAEWAPLLPDLLARVPELFLLGPLEPATRSGPAIWLRCVLARKIAGMEWPADRTPIFYLPRVGRKMLREIEDSPDALAPLLELQFRGSVWFHPNGKDWTVFAFVQSRLGMEIARDAATLAALRQALPEFSQLRKVELSGRRWEAGDFNRLLTPDPSRNLLMWLDQGDEFKKSRAVDEWDAFKQICQRDYGFNPETDGALRAALLLGQRAGAWAQVWERFAESPTLYPNLPEALRAAKPKDESDLFFKREIWPQINEAAENKLGDALALLQDRPYPEAAERIKALESAQGLRRNWVWRKLGKSGLAEASEHLAKLADCTQQLPAADSPDKLAAEYVAGGWQADAALLKALQHATSAKAERAIFAAARALYLPWVEAGAVRLQELVRHDPTAVAPQPLSNFGAAGEVILFADGLRFDVARELTGALGRAGLTVDLGWRWSALPSVTATAKPAVSPVASELTGRESDEEFVPSLKADARRVTADRFRQLLAEKGCMVLDARTGGDPTKAAWTECGKLDAHGHDEGWRLAFRIDEQVKLLANRVRELLDAGWKSVRVVTDHGWLLLPGGLPKIDLPKFLTQHRWGRCATMKPGNNSGLVEVPWFWNPAIRMALPPGVGCFVAGTEYAHGGLSLQECVIPMLTVRSASAPRSVAQIEAVKWIGLRCRITVTGDFTGVRADLRHKAADAKSSVAESVKEIAADGTVSLAVRDDSNMGSAALVVLLNEDGRPLHALPTTIGVNA